MPVERKSKGGQLRIEIRSLIYWAILFHLLRFAIWITWIILFFFINLDWLINFYVYILSKFFFFLLLFLLQHILSFIQPFSRVLNFNLFIFFIYYTFCFNQNSHFFNNYILLGSISLISINFAINLFYFNSME